MNEPHITSGRDGELKKVETSDHTPSETRMPIIDKDIPSPQFPPVRRSGRTAAKNANAKFLTKRLPDDQGSIPVTQTNVPAPKTQKIVPIPKATIIPFGKDMRLVLEEERKKLLRKLTAAKAAAESKMVTELARQKKVIKMYQRITRSTAGRDELNAIHNTKLRGGEGYKAGTYKPSSRQEAHNQRRLAECLYEDFLYFQNPINRENITVHMEHAKDEHGKFPKEPSKGGMPHAIFYDELEPYMDLFVKENIGMNKSHRNWKIHPDELHQLTPDARREPVGVGQRKVRETIKPTSWKFDHWEIERKRQGIDDETHTERRRMEMRSALRASSTLRGYHLGKLRTNAGLFLSAAETSNDWPTSYDRLGKVVDGRICKVPPKLSSGPKFDRHRKKTDAPQKPETLQKLLHGNVSESITDNETPELVLVYEHEITTQWGFESTYGRREFHAYRRLRPFSPVQSPPHSPTIDLEKINNRSRSAQTGTLNKNDDLDKGHEERWQQFGNGHGLTDSTWPTRNRMDHNGRILNLATAGNFVGQFRDASNSDSIAPDSEESVPAKGGEYTKSNEDSEDEGDLFTQSYREDSRDTDVVSEHFLRRRNVNSEKEHVKSIKRKSSDDGLGNPQAKRAKTQVKHTE